MPLGAHDTLRRGRDPYAADRVAARVHLARDAVLIGPWGNPDAEAACGQCLAMRWQRLRTRSEREALETGRSSTAAGGWPVLPSFVADAVRALYRRTAGQPQECDLPQVTRLDLATLQVVTHPLLREPLCPSCGPGDTQPDPELAPVGRVKPSPDAYRLCSPDDYGLPAAALANPVCGVLGRGDLDRHHLADHRPGGRHACSCAATRD